MTTLTEAVDAASSAAQEEYRRDGDFAPIVILTFGEYDLFVHLAGDGHPGDKAQLVVGTVKMALPIERAVFCSEAWMKVYSKEDAPKDPQRGDLAALHKGGDPEVRTALLTIGVDRDPRKWIVRTAVDQGDTFEIIDQEGVRRNNGYLLKAVSEPLWKQATEFPDVPRGAMEPVVAALAMALREYIVGIALAGPES